jgi:hypothetical protein
MWNFPKNLMSRTNYVRGKGFTKPIFITDDHLHINCLEMLVVIVAVQIWGKNLKGKTLLIFCDNEASVTVINSGSTKDSFYESDENETSSYVFISTIKDKKVSLNLLLYAT